LTISDLARQFWVDIFGKEVQSASTYSYTWMADQAGHLCIGILADFLATLLAGWALYGFGASYRQGDWEGMLVTVAAVSLWELSAYSSSRKDATGVFPLDKKTLRENAIIATAYMALGALLGFALHQRATLALLIAIAVLVLVVVLAPRWLAQKITWQKAALPYLFRLADALPTLAEEPARRLQELIDAPAPPGDLVCQVLIGGPIGSGRTAMATGIGTEFAFKRCKVRYLSFGALLEFAASAKISPYPDDTGPANIQYWHWFDAQVVIIDDIGPLIAASAATGDDSVVRFNKLLRTGLASINDILARCHTIWVLGELSAPAEAGSGGATLDEFAKAVAEFCKSPSPPLVVELARPSSVAMTPGEIRKPKVRRIDSARYR
jgi:hypothetical protein